MNGEVRIIHTDTKVFYLGDKAYAAYNFLLNLPPNTFAKTNYYLSEGKIEVEVWTVVGVKVEVEGKQ